MKKALFILIMVLSVHAAFASRYCGYGSNMHSRGIMAGGIVMMAVSAVPMIVFTAGIISDLSSGYLMFTGSCYTPFLSSVYVSCCQLTIGGALMLYLGIKRHNAGLNNYFGTEGQMMRNVGIVILTTAAIPTAITGLVSAFFVTVDPAFTFWAVADGFFSLAQLAAGAIFLGLGIHRIYTDGMIFPELSLSHNSKKGYNEGYGVNIGVRMKI